MPRREVDEGEGSGPIGAHVGSRGPTSCESRRALLALEEHGEPSDILQRALTLARGLGLELEVLRVLRRRPWNAMISRVYLGARLSVVRRSLGASRRLRAWCDEIVPGGSAPAPIHVRLGDFAEEASRLALERQAQLLIVPAREGHRGARVIGLAGSAGCPVLILRTTAGFRTVVAATDLEDDEYPVLRRAADVGQRLDAPVRVVHNVNPIMNPLPLEASYITATTLITDTVRLRRERLDDAASQLTNGVQPVVSNHCDTVGAILRETTTRGPALVVVGTRTKPWINRLIVKSVAAEVVNRTGSSVLVTPIRPCPWFGRPEYQRRARCAPSFPASHRPRVLER